MSRFICILLLILFTTPAHALDVSKFREKYLAEDFEGLAALCSQKEKEIEKDEYIDRLLFYCGEAKFNLYQKGGPPALLDEAIDSLQWSVHTYYLPSTAFALGKAHFASINDKMSNEERLARQKLALGEMWDAIIKKHAQEDFRKDILSDQIMSWTITYYKALIDGLTKGDKTSVGWLTAKTRMIADRYADVVPANAENKTRQGNIETVSAWMKDLYQSTYFDGNSVTGIYKFMGDRAKEEYDQTEATEDKFVQSLEHYKKGLSLAGSLKAKSVLKEKISDLTQWIISEDKEKKISYYSMGYQHASDALKLLGSRGRNIEGPTYNFEPDTDKLIEMIEVNYGRNLSGLLYFLWEKKDHHGVVDLRQGLLTADFDWKTKLHDLLRVADSSSKIARSEFGLPKTRSSLTNYNKYKGLCLTTAYRAFHHITYKYESRDPAYREDFCTTLDTYSAFLLGFGEITWAGQITRLYGPLCAEKSSDTSKQQSAKEGK
ncbi:MAG: hypothetical protein KKE17_15500 [Proteobacteria bacterium]|nr:hypothetical protein [Pseudomonadota bacterium]MBU1711403.1 hypothetical protein [Pseudomonadota bacterium]